MALAYSLHPDDTKALIQRITAEGLPLNDPGTGMLCQLVGAENIEEILGSLQGEIVIAVTPSMPFPAVTIILPKNEYLDKAVQIAAQNVNMVLPEKGELAALPIPAPVLVHVGSTAQEWIISSDQMLGQNLVAGNKGTFLLGHSDR